MRYFIQLICILFLSISTYSQDCVSRFKLQLNNIRGGVYAGQLVTCTEKGSGQVYSQKTNGEGNVTFEFPCNKTYDVTIGNYTRPVTLKSSPYDGTEMSRTMSYEPDMAKSQAHFTMSDADKKRVDDAVVALPDTTIINSSRMVRPKDPTNYTELTLRLQDLKGGPLQKETVVFSGTKRNKSFKGQTNAKGELLVFLPKGDTYTIHFLYTSNYADKEIPFMKGTSTGHLQLMYIGTEELLRRKKAEEERIKEEEKRLERERKEFEEYCKRERISEEEAFRRRLREASQVEQQDSVVSATLNRNNWSEKLIVCDLTGSMDPYATQLAVWYDLNYRKEKNLQFVFFNDGDQTSDYKKVIGETGGIYYQPSLGLDSLVSLMSYVRMRGNGGDCPENDMEALIKGVKMANPYKELVMIVDNNSPVKDIELLKDFDRPVRIILCGAMDGAVLLDYLLIAWRTKGSIHTIEDDIFNIATLSEGETITINGSDYRILGGQFYAVE